MNPKPEVQRDRGVQEHERERGDQTQSVSATIRFARRKGFLATILRESTGATSGFGLKSRLCLVSFATGAAGEAVFLLWALHRGFSMLGWIGAMALHGIAAIALVWGCTQILRSKLQSPALFWFLLPINLALPGAAVLILLALMGRRPPPMRSRSALSIHRPPVLNEGFPVHDLACRRVRQSILEILQHTDGPTRADAILALKDIEPVQAMPILRRALQDSDDLVRIYAQNLLTRIVERVEESTRQLEAQLKKSRTPSCLVHLAEQYQELVYLGVVSEPEACRSLMEKALVLLEEAIALEPGNAHVHLLALKYSLRARDIPRSRRHLASAETTPGCSAEQLLPLKGELAFLEKDWKALHSVLGEARPTTGGQIAAVRRFWKSFPFTRSSR